jgi:hypothetical protein
MRSPIYPHGQGRIIWACQLVLLILLGSGVYFGACMAMGIDVMKHVRRRAA